MHNPPLNENTTYVFVLYQVVIHQSLSKRLKQVAGGKYTQACMAWLPAQYIAVPSPAHLAGQRSVDLSAHGFKSTE